MYRYYQVPIIWDFLKMRSYISAPSANSPKSYNRQRLSSVTLADFRSTLIFRRRMKISKSLSRPLSSSPALITISSSLPMPTRSFRPVLLPVSGRLSESRLMRRKGRTFLLMEKSLSKNSKSVSAHIFLSYSITGYVSGSFLKAVIFSYLPLERFTYGFFVFLISSISSSLLRFYSSELEVPNSSRLILMSSFLRLTFILTYYSCMRLNSAYFYSSLISPTNSPLLLICLYSISLPELSCTTNSFLADWPSTNVLFTPYIYTLIIMAQIIIAIAFVQL